MLRTKELFHSETDPVPELRRDVQIIPIEDKGKQLLYFHDSMGYLSENFALDANVKPLLRHINGNFDVHQIHGKIDREIPTDQLLDFVQLLDQHRALNSEYFQFYCEQTENEFEASEIRQPMFAGQSYPANPDELKTFVIDMLPEKNDESEKKVHALYAPHIEISVGEKQYGEAFSHLKTQCPKRVIILATSHYASYYYRFYDGLPFIGSKKIFNLPGRVLSPDLDVILALNENSPQNGFTVKDRAHRIEHSIEFHLLFASQIWQHEFKIVPILISSFDDLYYSKNGDLTTKIDLFASQLKSFVDDETIILISGDLSHVGQKFGDKDPANLLREKVEQSDKQMLDVSITGNPDNLLTHLKKDYDSTRICGFPPLYTYLKMFPNKKGELLNYFWWDEKERNSAVSFGSILF